MVLNRKAGAILICLLSLTAHAWGLSSPLLDFHSWRQTQTAAIARNYYENGYRFFSPEINWEGASAGRVATEFPIYNYMMAMLWPVGGLGDLWGRILSAVFAALAAAYLYLLAREWLDERTALVAGLISAVLPVTVYFTHTVQPEAFGFMCMMAGLYHANKSGWKNFAAASVFLALAPLVKLPYSYIWLPAGWLAFRRAGCRALSVFIFPAAAVFAWYALDAASAPVQVVPSTGSGLVALISRNAVWLSAEFYRKQFVSRFPETVTTYTGLLLFAIGVFRSFRWAGWFFSIWFACSVVYLIAGGDYTFVHEYTLLPLAAPAAVFIAIGFSTLHSGKPWMCKLALVLLIAIPVNTAVRIRHWYSLHDTFLLDAREKVAAISGKDDLFLCNTDNLPLYLYHIHRNGYTKPVRGADIRNILAGYRAKGVRFLITSKETLERDGESAAYLAANLPIAAEGRDYVIFRL